MIGVFHTNHKELEADIPRVESKDLPPRSIFDTSGEKASNRDQSRFRFQNAPIGPLDNIDVAQ
ncbi:MAG: hypothetical protein ACI9C1_001853 [Candidatus Aldehydirespiratoraceae bacterium]|jgi:hypothetical protein